jgi:hypothetical protein
MRDVLGWTLSDAFEILAPLQFDLEPRTSEYQLREFGGDASVTRIEGQG